MDTFTSSLSLSIYIIELSERMINLDEKKRGDYLEYIRQEFFAIDDEFSNLFDIIITILNCHRDKESIEIYLNNLSESGVDLLKLELCVRSCLDYLNDFN